ncbi:methionyl-tRNA formyltransferase [Campylobacter ureolyticus]|uniref:Methionyl-tRNA formyltransferase n=1 Tax=Campylobacter ureolyticus TaxID=827 RepID=A0A9Q4KLW3_9BACT|nr:methionyl-tRNA formyltransferase [Campylobacter ureolyticus]MCZ6160011.1 methionyl-tRNA formyltransferase [Campylobacter ureolyticus]MCZ6163790.1 methionyl-tRNA formyltransferase [Campylobacter ureolyticus]MCZ6165594.1 methionyl-tRNA formyltransferase [Campylobacter ureolyticus]MCZ6167268.1 methionyl-tRNA formyltransferase [Campylobacter ureolyticus]MCZ6169459.1 methionyl-tRNA formyltransferase [Campylobacter ureolyticus]
MRVIFMGTPSYAVAILDKLIEKNYNIVGVFTQPDKVVGRKKILTPPDVKNYILKNNLNIEIFQPNSLKEDTIYEEVLTLKPDIIIVAAYGQILPKNILEICPCINLHASILPKYRGASPIQSAILNDDKISGVTAMKMGEKLDDGDMLGFSFLDISRFKSDEVFKQMEELASNLIVKILKNLNNIENFSQFDALSSKCSKIKKDDGLIKFSDDAKEVFQKFKAFYPWPGIFLENGTKLLNIEFIYDNESSDFGKIVNLDRESFDLQFKNGVIKVFKIQEKAKKPLLASDFINGKRLKIGDIL